MFVKKRSGEKSFGKVERARKLSKLFSTAALCQIMKNKRFSCFYAVVAKPPTTKPSKRNVVFVYNDAMLGK
jgi:hypothetical protein